MLNRVELIGNLGRDPEVRATQSGDKVATLSVATSERWNDKNTGEKKERTEWHRVVVFGKVAEICEKYLSKGSKAYFEGKLQTRKWTDQSGNDRYSTEVVLSGFGGKMIMLDGKGQSDDGPRYGDHRSGAAETEAAPPGGDLDDEIPF